MSRNKFSKKYLNNLSYEKLIIKLHLTKFKTRFFICDLRTKEL